MQRHRHYHGIMVDAVHSCAASSCSRILNLPLFLSCCGFGGTGSKMTGTRHVHVSYLANQAGYTISIFICYSKRCTIYYWNFLGVHVWYRNDSCQRMFIQGFHGMLGLYILIFMPGSSQTKKKGSLVIKSLFRRFGNPQKTEWRWYWFFDYY